MTTSKNNSLAVLEQYSQKHILNEHRHLIQNPLMLPNPEQREELERLISNLQTNSREMKEEKNAYPDEIDQFFEGICLSTISLIEAYLKYHKASNAFSKLWHQLLFSIQLHQYMKQPSSTTHLSTYQKVILGLSIISTCIVFAFAGLAIGIAIGAAIGGGAGSVLPGLGSAFGALVGGGVGAMIGVIQGLGAAVAIAAAVGFSVLGAMGAIVGWFLGRSVLPKKPSGASNLEETMRQFAATLDSSVAKKPAKPSTLTISEVTHRSSIDTIRSDRSDTPNTPSTPIPPSPGPGQRTPILLRNMQQRRSSEHFAPLSSAPNLDRRASHTPNMPPRPLFAISEVPICG